MAVSKADVWFYPEEYLLEEDEMGESTPQFRLIKYLVEVIEWYYRSQNWLVTGNLEIYHPEVKNSQGKVIPDVAVFQGIEISEAERQNLSSWDISEKTPAPPLVFEISSASTWRNDIWGGEYRKPAVYGRVGVREYFAYDPREPQAWAGTNGQRLKGWRYSRENNVVQAQEIQPNAQGWLESQMLRGWLVPDGAYLRLYNQQGMRQPTEAEAERAAKEAERAAKEVAEQRIAALERQLRQLKGES